MTAYCTQCGTKYETSAAPGARIKCRGCRRTIIVGTGTVPDQLAHVTVCPLCGGPASVLERGVGWFLIVILLFPLGLLALLCPRTCCCLQCGATFKSGAFS